MSGSNQLLALAKSRIGAFQKEIRVISIPLGRQFSCCDAANLFESYVRNSVRGAQLNIAFVSTIIPNPSVLLPISSAVEEVLQTSTRIFTNFANGCYPSSCCVEASRAVALVSNFILSNLLLLSGDLAAGSVTAETAAFILGFLSGLFNKLVKFIVEVSYKNSAKNSTNNVIVTSTELAPPIIPAVNSLNIDKCCQAIVSAVGDAFRRFPDLVFVGTPGLITAGLISIDNLTDTFLNALKRLLCCCDCCVGTSEGILNLYLSAVSRIPFVQVPPTAVTNAVTEENFRQDTNALLRNACYEKKASHEKSERS